MTDKFEDIRPIARQTDLVIKHLEDEILVYDLTTDRAHCLNATAALVWKHCDGRRSLAQLGALLARELASEQLSLEEESSHELSSHELSQLRSAQVGQELARLAVIELAKKRLLMEVDEAEPWPTAPQVSRRALVRSLGVALGALPIVTSIISPTPAEAATCLSSGQACTTSAECCSGLCNTSTTGTCA